MTYLLIFIVTCITITSQVLLKFAMKANYADLTFVDVVRAYVFNPYVIGSIALQGIGFVLWSIVVKNLKLGVAFALSGASFYILISLVDYLIYGETLRSAQVYGIVLISVGVFLVAFYK